MIHARQSDLVAYHSQLAQSVKPTKSDIHPVLKSLSIASFFQAAAATSAKFNEALHSQILGAADLKTQMRQYVPISHMPMMDADGTDK